MSNFWSWEGPKNWWYAAPEGAWTFVEPVVPYGHWVGGIMLLLFAWMMINTPYYVVGTVYFLMTLLFMIVYIAERIVPQKIVIAIIAPIATPTALYDVLLGVIIGVAFALLYPISGITMPLLVITPIAIANFLLSCFAIPLAEEYPFGGIVTASGAEDFGIVPGLMFVSFFFPIFHWAVIGAAIESLLMLGIFRLIASTLILWRRNLLVGISMHVAVNIVGFWAAMIAVGV